MVVYKIDRLVRALMDFAKLVELFEAHDVTFVSITQSFNTTTSMRFETKLLATEENLAALADLSGVWIGRIHDRNPPTAIVLDMDSSVSPTHGEQEGTAYNGHFGCTCYHPLSAR